MQDRRTFVKCGLGLCSTICVGDLSGETGVSTWPRGQVRMTFGVLADIHITDCAQLPYFEKALRKFDEWKVDAVLACGDLADFGLRQQLQLVADTWFKVFPDGKGSDGRPVVNLLHYGDHDLADKYVDREEAKDLCPDDGVRHNSLIFDGDNRRRFWEECFHEPWQPIVRKDVKGYPFVLYHFSRGTPDNLSGQYVPGLKDFLAKQEFDPRKPVFFSQHRIPKGTACGPHSWGQDAGETTEIFSHIPNLVAFCGHAHVAGNCELNIWQGAFTCIQVPSLRYAITLAGRENGYCLSDRPPRPPVQTMPQFPSQRNGIHQGFLCRVYDDALVVRRWEFENDGALGPDWVLPFSSFALPAASRPFAFEMRRKDFPIPQFASNAKVTLAHVKADNRLGELREMVAVSFPPALQTSEGLRADDYEVTLEMFDFGIVKVLSQHRVYSPRYTHPAEMDTEQIVCLVDAAEFPADRRVVMVSVRPVNAFGVKGEPIKTLYE